MSASADTLYFNNHKLSYELSKKWKVFSKTPSEGYLDVIYKRTPIKDSRGIQVIPNLVIKLIKIVPDPSRDSTNIEMFTTICLLNFAPPEVLNDYKNSRDLAPEFGLDPQNSFGFNSPYFDKFGSNHICLYFIVYDKERYGLFILIDSTEEVFPKIKNEVTTFLRSIHRS